MALRVSSFCSGGTCVLVERIGDVIRVTDADRRRNLLFSIPEWDVFVKGVKAGEFDPEALGA